MRFVRPVVAQNYLRGKSLRHRDFSSSRSNHYDVVEDAMEMGKSSVVDRIYDYGLGVALGTGLGYLLRGTNAAKAEQVEEDLKSRQLKLDMTEEKVKLVRELCEGKRIKSS